MYNSLSEFNWTAYPNALVGGAIAAAIVTFIFVAIILFAVFYVYHSLTWMKIAKKLKFKKAWLAWIPFAGSSMRLHLGKFHWAWIFLIVIPFVGWIAVGVLFIISNWRVFEKLRYSGWLALSPLLGLIWGGLGTLAYGIVIGIVAWKKKR